MAESYDTHKDAVEAAFPVPPADWQAIEFFPHLHQFGEVAAFRAEVNRQGFVFYAKLTRSDGVDAWTILEVTQQNGHRQMILGPFKSWRHCRDAFWPYWRRTVTDLQIDEIVHRYGADIFDDPRTGESDLTRIRFERGEYRLEFSPEFDRDLTAYEVSGTLEGALDISGIRTSSNATVLWTRHGTPFDTLTGLSVQSGTVLACTVTSEDRSGSTVYVFTFAEG